MDGIIILNKPIGMTSHDVCYKLKKILGTKKIGHAGTLDPIAQGVLVVLVGYATRLNEYISLDDKQYISRFTFGFTSDTFDTMSTVVKSVNEPSFDINALNAAISANIGTFDQIPPIYSAIKVNGKHLYDYARQGQSVEIASRRVNVYSIEIVNQDIPNDVVLKIDCSKGTYIRSICRDIGEYLGCGAVMNALTRTKSGVFDIKNAYTLESIKEMAEIGDLSFLCSSDIALTDMPSVCLDEKSEKSLKAGNFISRDNIINITQNREKTDAQKVKLYLTNRFCAIGILTAEGVKPDKVFI